MPFVLDREIDPLYKEGIKMGTEIGLIKVGLELKFNSNPQWLYPYLKNILDIDEMRKIKDFISIAKTIDEFEEFVISLKPRTEI